MQITLRPITPDNWRDCIRLQTHEQQQGFVAPNVYSLAQAYVFAEDTPLAIYADETLVGFLMYALDPDDNKYWLFRFMIDREQQGKGYGRKACEAYIDLMRTQPDCDAIWLSISAANTVAEQLYRSLGFVPTGVIQDDGEIELCLRLAADGSAPLH
jgi:diamine N-acetyltransferase